MRSILVASVAVVGMVAPGLLRRVEIPPLPDNTPLPTAKPYGLGKSKFAHVSSSSCAAAACHGGGELGKLHSEHSTWAANALDDEQYDPHARAYRVLFNADSVNIGKLMGMAEPHKEALCLKCHATEGVKPAEAASEGVGCGSCHGPAEKWLDVHMLPEWQALSNQTKWNDYGFVPTKNLVARVSACASCHVGDSDREVNHDLIAAGHPRLSFEYTNFHYNAKYRQHWTEPTPQPDFEVRAWTVGQAATLRAATDLLRARAERAARDDSKTPWPEFSGLSCYACHQTIGDGEVRRDAGTTRRPPGVPGWEVWSNSAVGVAARLGPDAFPGMESPNLPGLAALRKLMQKPQPNPKQVASRASRAVAELDAWLAALQAAEDKTPAKLAADLPRKFAHALAANALSPDRSRLADHDWDSLAANYLGCASMYHASGGKLVEPKWTAPLNALTTELEFPDRKTAGERFDSPFGFGKLNRDRVRDKLRDLFKVTAP